MNGRHDDDPRFNFTVDELRRLENNWKSDVDLKLDRLVRFVDKYENFLTMALKREETREKWRNAVIEKTLAGLAWIALIFVLASSWEWVKSHVTRQ